MDKVVHFILFFVFSLFMIYDLINIGNYKIQKKNLFLIVISVGVFVALITELTQHYVILSRTGSIFDFIFNLTGIAAGVGGYWLFKTK